MSPLDLRRAKVADSELNQFGSTGRRRPRYPENLVDVQGMAWATARNRLAAIGECYKGSSLPASRSRWRRCCASGSRLETSAQYSVEWLLTVRWASSWTTTYSIRAGGSMTTRQLKRRVPSGGAASPALALVSDQDFR